MGKKRIQKKTMELEGEKSGKKRSLDQKGKGKEEMRERRKVLCVSKKGSKTQSERDQIIAKDSNSTGMTALSAELNG